MPYEFQYENIPVGTAASSKRKGDGHGMVCSLGCLTSFDGVDYVRAVEGHPAEVLDRIESQKKFMPSEVSHLVVKVNPSGLATVYVNEIRVLATVQAKRNIAEGDPVMRSDFSEFSQLHFDGLSIDDADGFFCVLNFGWRSLYYFDFTPLLPGGVVRNYSISSMLANCLNRLAFNEYANVPAAAWEEMIGQGWFLFRCLSDDLLQKIIAYSRESWDLDELLDDLMIEVKSLLRNANWGNCSHFADHQGFFDVAAQRFLAGDYVSCVAIIYPRIEGVLRDVLVAWSGNHRPNQESLSKLVAASRSSWNPLLTERFSQYLEEVFFSSFDTRRGVVPLSRNSVGHGVATQDGFNAKSAALGFLILLHLKNVIMAIENDKKNAN